MAKKIPFPILLCMVSMMVVLVWGFAPGPALAQAQAGPVLTLEELLQKTLELNKTLQAGKHSVKKVLYQSRANVAGSRTRLDMTAALYGNEETYSGLYPRWGEQAGFILSQPLDISGALDIQDKIARSQVEAERIRYMTNANNILSSAAQLYVQSVWARNSIAGQGKILSSREENFKITEALFEKELIGKLDYLRAKSKVDQVRAKIKDYESQYRLYLEGLSSLLDGTSIETVPELDSVNLPVTSRDAEKMNNPELDSIELSRQVAMLSRKSAVLERAPSLSLQVQYNPVRSERAELDYDELTGGIYLSLPIFDGGSASNKAAGYAEQVKELDFSYTAKKLEIESDIKAYGEQLELAREQVNLWGEQKKATEQELEIANELFKAGMISQTDVLNVMDEQQNAEISYLSALLNVNLAAINLKKASGSFLDIVGVLQLETTE